MIPSVEVLQWLKDNLSLFLLLLNIAGIAWALLNGHLIFRTSFTREREEKLYYREKAEVWERRTFELLQNLNRLGSASEQSTAVTKKALSIIEETSKIKAESEH